MVRGAAGCWGAQELGKPPSQQRSWGNLRAMALHQRHCPRGAVAERRPMELPQLFSMRPEGDDVAAAVFDALPNQRVAAPLRGEHGSVKGRNRGRSVAGGSTASMAVQRWLHSRRAGQRQGPGVHPWHQSPTAQSAVPRWMRSPWVRQHRLLPDGRNGGWVCQSARLATG